VTRRLLFLGAAALAVRLVYVLVIARAPVGVGGDAGFYHSAANLIVHGKFLYREILGHSYVTAEHPPLYPLVLSASSLLGEDSLLAHRIVGCLIGSVNVVLIAILARRLAGDRAALIAGAMAAVYPPLVTADGLVMSEPLFVLLVTAALLTAITVRERAGVGPAAALGAVVGLAALTRGEGILLLPLLAWPAAVSGAPGGRASRALATTAAALVLIVPWVVRNDIVFHRPMLAADANTVIAGANCPDTYYGRDIGWWSLHCMEQQRTRAQVDNGDASTGAAWSYVSNHIMRTPLVAVVRVLRTFDLYQPLRQGNLEPRRRWVDVVGLAFFYPVLILAGIGLWRAPRPRWLVLAPVWMVIIVSVLGWGIGRFRVAADVSLLVLAASALAQAGALRLAAARRLRRPAPLRAR
jgi:4-amino-4-deoxy-L-arabinose transferase-like glycosyltransferase